MWGEKHDGKFFPSHQEAVERGALLESAPGFPFPTTPLRKPQFPHLYNGQGSFPGPAEAGTEEMAGLELDMHLRSHLGAVTSDQSSQAASSLALVIERQAGVWEQSREA